jgi:methylenetetrahydrofolate dehydrogenase (NADP+)/methenyltetrahydrofolate cyclohydrolase
MAQIIDGLALANQIKKKIKAEVALMKNKPGLAVILVGEDPASQIYVNSKEKDCQEVGFYSRKIILPANINEDKILKEINILNNDPKIHGILVQLPLPKQFNEEKIINAIKPEKDADCFQASNFGRVILAYEAADLDKILVSCTPKGVIKLIESTGQVIAGKKAVVVGRSNIVGKPIASLLLKKDATVTVCHSKTKNLKEETKSADILVACIGKPKFITVDMVKKGAIIIDVGINRIEKGLAGDVDFDNVKEVAGYITPVPGGVGPMTRACLLENTLLLARKLQ